MVYDKREFYMNHKEEKSYKWHFVEYKVEVMQHVLKIKLSVA
jgi:hypothetical protein